MNEFVVGIGTRHTPTPKGTFYVWVRVPQPESTGPYGNYALGLGGFSPILTDWPGGGRSAVHGRRSSSQGARRRPQPPQERTEEHPAQQVPDGIALIAPLCGVAHQEPGAQEEADCDQHPVWHVVDLHTGTYRVRLSVVVASADISGIAIRTSISAFLASKWTAGTASDSSGYLRTRPTPRITRPTVKETAPT